MGHEEDECWGWGEDEAKVSFWRAALLTGFAPFSFRGDGGTPC